ncbi:MAG TPA: DUF2202 domain-containing protein, partial [Daejeonella sp.]|uniref:DUF2202 domain-containing protein n=1 Tax=Daejeonella sp. TaxID=2805397 RepID=UPI002ED9EADA
MKNQLKITGLGLILTVIIFTSGSCKKDKVSISNRTNTENINAVNIEAQINTLPKENLSADELNSISFLREEEKLAMDVYLTLYNKWGV